MKKVILFLTLVPCIAFGQITSGTDNFQQPVKEFSELSIENRTAWVDTSVEYCYYNWNLAAGNWDPNIAKLIYTYDLDGNLIEFLYMILDAGIWVSVFLGNLVGIKLTICLIFLGKKKLNGFAK